MTPKQGWYVAELYIRNKKTTFYVPTLWTIHCVTQLDYPFSSYEDCLEFIKKEVIGQGLRDDVSD